MNYHVTRLVLTVTQPLGVQGLLVQWFAVPFDGVTFACEVVGSIPCNVQLFQVRLHSDCPISPRKFLDS
jgi:hypothetical protein